MYLTKTKDSSTYQKRKLIYNHSPSIWTCKKKSLRLYWQDQLIELEPTGKKQVPSALISASTNVNKWTYNCNIGCQGTLHTVTSLLGRNEEEAPITTAAPYANVNILTQSQNTYKEYHSTCKAIFQILILKHHN